METGQNVRLVGALPHLFNIYSHFFHPIVQNETTVYLPLVVPLGNQLAGTAPV